MVNDTEPNDEAFICLSWDIDNTSTKGRMMVGSRKEWRKLTEDLKIVLSWQDQGTQVLMSSRLLKVAIDYTIWKQY